MNRILTFVPLLALALPSWSQGPTEGGTVTQASLGLLDDPAIRKEVKLSAAQDTFVKGQFKRVNDELSKIKRPTSEAEAKSAQARVISLQKGLYATLQKQLTPPQGKRLRELGLQFFGPFSMLSPEIQKELALTPAQIAKVKAAQKSLFDKTKELQATRQSQVRMIPQPKDRTDQKAVQEYVGKVQALMAKFGPGDGKTIAGYKKAEEAQALKALTAAQMSRWQAMKGVKFTPPKRK